MHFLAILTELKKQSHSECILLLIAAYRQTQCLSC